MSNRFVEGAVKYPDDLPCPQIETDLTPRERRYISDIGQVKKLRTFQRDYQATRQNISFVFTPEQARDFQLWYKDEIIDGGAWFYADWPILHKETDIAYRFVTRPVWRVLALGNFHVSATVELYEGRKVGKYLTVYTSKLYPIIFWNDMGGIYNVKASPTALHEDDMRAQYAIISGRIKGGIKDLDAGADDLGAYHYSIVQGNIRQYIFSEYEMRPDDMGSAYSIVSGIMNSHLITYDYETDDLGATQYSIISGELI